MFLWFDSIVFICYYDNYMDNTGWDGYVQRIASLVENRENYQRLLGKTASIVVKDYGNEALIKLADDVKETSGRTISITTLRNYKWVWEKTSPFDLPEDLSFRCLQSLAASKNPEKYVQLIKEGRSSSEIVRLIREERGLSNKTKKWICSSCGAENVQEE